MILGLRWHIGNGTNIKIWGDGWLLGGDFFWPTTSPRILNPNAHVSSLLNPDDGCWNIELIRQVFNEADVKLILQIPRHQNRREDRLVWHFNNDGIYTVKSGYHTYIQRIREDQGASQPSSQLWKRIWGAQVPNKFKHFIWRTAHDALPTKMNLCKRNIIEEAVCPVCQTTIETTTHILRDCSLARTIWRIQNIQIPDAGTEPSPLLWIQDMNATLTADKWIRFIVIHCGGSVIASLMGKEDGKYNLWNG